MTAAVARDSTWDAWVAAKDAEDAAWAVKTAVWRAAKVADAQAAGGGKAAAKDAEAAWATWADAKAAYEARVVAAGEAWAAYYAKAPKLAPQTRGSV